MIHFVVHDKDDSVGMVVVEGVRAGDKLRGWIMAGDEELEFVAKADIPIGHKLALVPLQKGDTVLKYGVDMGRAIADIEAGDHLHVHNIKTKRW